MKKSDTMELSNAAGGRMIYAIDEPELGMAPKITIQKAMAPSIPVWRAMAPKITIQKAMAPKITI
ncbi:MAG: hypothetical protein IJ123_06455 [Blautia sp.]|nr:hypothetical protein [Blautia sp.]